MQPQNLATTRNLVRVVAEKNERDTNDCTTQFGLFAKSSSLCAPFGMAARKSKLRNTSPQREVYT